MATTQASQTSSPELQRLVQDYSNYFSFPQINEQKVNIINETVEQMLAQLDELNALVETVKLNAETTRSLLPSLVEQTKRLDKSFEVIDGLIEFVNLVDTAVTKLDDRLTEAEQSSSEALSQRAKQLLGSLGRQQQQQKSSDASTVSDTEQAASINVQEYMSNFRSKLSKKV